jgi:hypothetical protein
MIRTCDVSITAEAHQKLMAHLFPGDGDEHGAVLRAGVVTTEDGPRLLVRDVVPAIDGTDYVAGQVGYRALKPTFIHSQIVTCRDEKLAYLAVHNHDSDDQVAFSRVDMASHERGYPALLDIGRGVPVGALVYGRRSVEADLWLPDGSRLALGEYRIIGASVERLHSGRQAVGPAPSEYDRQVRMFGAAGQAVLGRSKVAVVGLGGVGSLVAEYLARLGVGEIVLIDTDHIEETNLSRVVGAGTSDVEAALLKVQIAIRHLREARPGLSLTPIAEDVAKGSVALQLRDCDFIFLGADSMRARLVVNALAHQYLIPAVQLGAKVQALPGGRLEEAFSAVRHVRPGHGCLWCNGWIDPTQLAIESKSDAERIAQAYGVNEPNPSVITLNAVAAAHGVNDFLVDFLGLRTSGREHAYEHFHALSGKIQKVAPRHDPACRECMHRLGRGDALELPTIAG